MRYKYTPRGPADVARMMDELRRRRHVDQENRRLRAELATARTRIRELERAATQGARRHESS